jgi:GNAT superfamily N-acetyltransferase
MAVTDPGERAELEAFRDFGALLQENGDGAVADVGGGACVAIPALRDVLMVNRMLGLGVETPATEAHLDEIADFFAAARTRYYVSASRAAGRELEPLLRAHGFEPGYAWAIFRRRVEPYLAETGLRVEQARAGADFGTIVAAAYEFPPDVGAAIAALPGRTRWHCYVAYAGDEPAGAAAVFVEGRGAWLGFAGTAPEHRRKGAQNALMAARIAKAASLGAEVLATETGELLPDRPSGSYRNIERAGFELAYVRPNYASTG